MSKAIALIRSEHRSIAAVLRGLLDVVAAIESRQVEPDFRLIDAMVYYIEAMPESLHHPKEDEFIYRALESRAAHVRNQLDEIHAEHEQGNALGRELLTRLLAWHVLGPPAFDAFASSVRVYAELQWGHMSKEEEFLLPLAERLLQPDDWKAIEAAFDANDESRLEPERRRVFRELFRILAARTTTPLDAAP